VVSRNYTKTAYLHAPISVRVLITRRIRSIQKVMLRGYNLNSIVKDPSICNKTRGSSRKNQAVRK